MNIVVRLGSSYQHTNRVDRTRLAGLVPANAMSYFSWIGVSLSILIGVNAIFGLNLVVFLVLFLLFSIAAVFFALDANARDAERVDLWYTNRLFDLQNRITLIDPNQLARLLHCGSQVITTLSSPSLIGSACGARLPSPFPVKRKPFLTHQRSLSNGQVGPALPVDLKHDIFTGHTKIDEQIRDLLGLLLRDYVYSWYSPLSHNHEFVNELRILLQIVIRSLANRMASIDKIQFVTTKLVDHFVSHLQLFRMAQQHFKMTQAEGE